MFGFLLLRGDKLHPEAFMEEKNEAMMVREPWLEIINKQGNQNPRMLTIIKPSVRLTQSDNVRARFNSSNRHSLRYYRLFFDKFFTQYPDKEKGRLKTDFGFSDDLLHGRAKAVKELLPVYGWVRRFLSASSLRVAHMPAVLPLFMSMTGSPLRV